MSVLRVAIARSTSSAWLSPWSTGWPIGTGKPSINKCQAQLLRSRASEAYDLKEEEAAMSISTVEVIDMVDAEARLASLRRRVGDVELLKARGEAYGLDIAETALYEELRDLEFLLGRD